MAPRPSDGRLPRGGMLETRTNLAEKLDLDALVLELLAGVLERHGNLKRGEEEEKDGRRHVSEHVSSRAAQTGPWRGWPSARPQAEAERQARPACLVRVPLFTAAQARSSKARKKRPNASRRPATWAPSEREQEEERGRWRIGGRCASLSFSTPVALAALPDRRNAAAAFVRRRRLRVLLLSKHHSAAELRRECGKAFFDFSLPHPLFLDFCVSLLQPQVPLSFFSPAAARSLRRIAGACKRRAARESHVQLQPVFLFFSPRSFSLARWPCAAFSFLLLPLVRAARSASPRPRLRVCQDRPRRRRFLRQSRAAAAPPCRFPGGRGRAGAPRGQTA